MAASNEDLMRELRIMREEWAEHILPLVRQIEELISMHGDPVTARSRIAYVNVLLEREADRKALRKAIIEKTTVAALWAMILYIFIAVSHEVRDTIIEAWFRPPK